LGRRLRIMPTELPPRHPAPPSKWRLVTRLLGLRLYGRALN
jgi:hypothetical protein